MGNNGSVTDCVSVCIIIDVGMMLVIAIVCVCLMVSSAMTLYVAMYVKKQKTVKMPPMPEEPPAGKGCHGVKSKK